MHDFICFQYTESLFKAQDIVYFSKNSVYVSREPIFSSCWQSPREGVAELAEKLPVLPAELSGKKSMDVSWKLTGSKFSCESHLSAGCCRSKKGKKQKEKHRGITNIKFVAVKLLSLYVIKDAYYRYAEIKHTENSLCFFVSDSRN